MVFQLFFELHRSRQLPCAICGIFRTDALRADGARSVPAMLTQDLRERLLKKICVLSLVIIVNHTSSLVSLSEKVLLVIGIH